MPPPPRASIQSECRDLERRVKTKSLAIPLRTNDFSNSSQVVSLLTRERGLVDLIVKGAYRPRNNFQGPIDVAVLREAVFIERHEGSGLGVLTESQVIDGWRGLRASFNRHLAASHILGFLRAVATGGESAHDLFDLSRGALDDIACGPVADIGDAVLWFELRALRLLGFLSPIEACVRCARPWPGRVRGAWFSPREGGLVCSSCRTGPPSRRTASPLAGAVVGELGRWAESPRREGLDPFPPRVRRELHRLLRDGSTFFLERRLETYKYAAAWI